MIFFLILSGYISSVSSLFSAMNFHRWPTSWDCNQSPRRVNILIICEKSNKNTSAMNFYWWSTSCNQTINSFTWERSLNWKKSTWHVQTTWKSFLLYSALHSFQLSNAAAIAVCIWISIHVIFHSNFETLALLKSMSTLHKIYTENDLCQ